MEVIIKRHCVGRDGESGLSPLQKELLDNAAPIRIAEAPTGAGKSYAFEKAMARGGRVLFIVPTRRLAQNLLAGLSQNLVCDHGWSEEDALRKLALWSSDATAKLRTEGVVKIGARRIREIFDIDPTRAGGEMIVAIPETVSHLLLRFGREAGQTDVGVFDLLSNFEHIVFDEFHTISARGFGLAGLIAKLAAEADGVRAKVSFLSATPLDIRPVLRKLDVPEKCIVDLHEELTESGRWVHGEVRLLLSNEPRLSDLVRDHAEAIRHEIEKGRQVVVIYDRLHDLMLQLFDMQAALREAGVGQGRALLINSISDSTVGDDGTGFFAVGRQQPPERFDVLIATASVEMGVTFRADMLFMEPGFEPMNFLQRYGRAARGDHWGLVVVRWDGEEANRRPWLRELRRWMEEHNGKEAAIGELTAILGRAARLRFEDCPEDSPRHFGRLSNRAAYAAGLYWKVLMDHWSSRGGRWGHLKAHQPKPAGHVHSLLQQVRALERDRIFGKPAKEWCNRFEAEARTLRDIAPRIRVLDERGRSMHVPELWLRRSTDILERFPLVFSDRDGLEEVRITGDLNDWIRDERRFVEAKKKVIFPHTPYSLVLKDDSSIVDEWCRRLKDSSGHNSDAWQEFPEAMAAAEKLVRLTGLVVGDDDDLELDAISGVC
jgi:CRISPR-associated endonuclease/helicase Cas3